MCSSPATRSAAGCWNPDTKQAPDRHALIGIEATRQASRTRARQFGGSRSRPSRWGRMGSQRRTGRSADDGFTADSDREALESARAPAPVPESRRRVTMRAQSIRSRATRPARASSCSAMPSGDVNALSMMEPRLSLGCGCGGRVDRVTDDPSGEEHRGQRQQRRVEESGSDEQLCRRYRREREHSEAATARFGPPAIASRTASRFSMRFGESRERNRRLPDARTRRPHAAASAPISTRGIAARPDCKREEHEHGPGRRTERRQQVDPEHDPGKKQVAHDLK